MNGSSGGSNGDAADNAHRYCREKVAIPGSSHYYSLLFTASAGQEATCALQAWHMELRAIACGSSDIVVARRKLAWWAEELVQGERGEPRHPITRALTRALAAPGSGDVSFAELAPVVTTTASLLERDGPANECELEGFCAATGGAVESLCVRMLGARAPETVEQAYALGTGLELAELTRPLPGERRLPERAAPGRVPGLPGGGSPPTHAAVLEGLGHRARRAETLIRRALAAIPREDRAGCRGRIIYAELTLGYLRALHRAGYLPDGRRIGMSPLRKLWIAWRVSRRESGRGL